MRALLSPPILIGLAAVLGLCVGSFLNVVIHRLPLMMERAWRRELWEAGLEPGGAGEEAPLTLLWPPSHCPGCSHAVRPWENLPVLSYLALRGRCGHCGGGIGWRYPVVELLCGLGFAALAALAGPVPPLAGAMALTAALLALACIDLDHRMLPDSIVLPLLWLGLLANLDGGLVPLRDAVLGAAAGYGALWAVSRLYRLLRGVDGMGDGDLKMLAALGAWLGWRMLPPLLLLACAAAFLALLAAAALGRRERLARIPLGTFLAAGGWLCLAWMLARGMAR